MTPSALSRVPLVAALSLILGAVALPGLAGPATPAAALSDAPAVVEQQPDWSIDWQSLQDIVLDRLRDAPAPTDAAAQLHARRQQPGRLRHALPLPRFRRAGQHALTTAPGLFLRPSLPTSVPTPVSLSRV
jgi:hypothetical protein